MREEPKSSKLFYTDGWAVFALLNQPRRRIMLDVWDDKKVKLEEILTLVLFEMELEKEKRQKKEKKKKKLKTEIDFLLLSIK
jgi:hypothetical protein